MARQQTRRYNTLTIKAHQASTRLYKTGETKEPLTVDQYSPILNVVNIKLRISKMIEAAMNHPQFERSFDVTYDSLAGRYYSQSELTSTLKEQTLQHVKTIMQDSAYVLASTTYVWKKQAMRETRFPGTSAGRYLRNLFGDKNAKDTVPFGHEEITTDATDELTWSISNYDWANTWLRPLLKVQLPAQFARFIYNIYGFSPVLDAENVGAQTAINYIPEIYADNTTLSGKTATVIHNLIQAKVTEISNIISTYPIVSPLLVALGWDFTPISLKQNTMDGAEFIDKEGFNLTRIMISDSLNHEYVEGYKTTTTMLKWFELMANWSISREYTEFVISETGDYRDDIIPKEFIYFGKEAMALFSFNSTISFNNDPGVQIESIDAKVPAILLPLMNITQVLNVSSYFRYRSSLTAVTPTYKMYRFAPTITIGSWDLTEDQAPGTTKSRSAEAEIMYELGFHWLPKTYYQTNDGSEPKRFTMNTHLANEYILDPDDILLLKQLTCYALVFEDSGDINYFLTGEFFDADSKPEQIIQNRNSSSGNNQEDHNPNDNPNFNA